MSETTTDLRPTVIGLIVRSGPDGMTAADLETAAGSLTDAGYTSLAYMRLIDDIENTLGVYLDPEAATERFTTVDGIIGLIEAADE